MNITEIARLCHQVNKVYCEAIGDNSQVDWDNAPDWQKKSAIGGVEYHLHPLSDTPEDTHNNWMKQKQAEGWKYGKIKDAEKKEHPCLVPYNQLPKEQKVKDYIFKAICDFFKKKGVKYE